MAKGARTQPTTNQYFVYDATLTTLGGIQVMDVDGQRVVRMSNKQAQYFLDQGIIGLQKEADTSDAGKAARKQFRGGAA